MGAPAPQPRSESTASPGQPELSAREQTVADLVAEGLSNRQIAHRLTISERTAQSHVQHILTKWGMDNRTQIAARIHTSQSRRHDTSLMCVRLDAESTPMSNESVEALRRLVADSGGAIEIEDPSVPIIVFPTVEDAIRAGVEIHLRRAVAADPTVAGATGSCVAIHRGPMIRAPIGLVGRALAEVRRLAIAGHVGQLLISATASMAVRLPELISLHPMGTFDLPGVGAMTIHEIRHPRIAVIDRALSPRAGLLHNLPRSSTSFVGRTEEVAAVSNLLSQHRLVTIVGQGGSGKTRLAVETARHAGLPAADGLFFVDLSALDVASDVEDHVIAAVGVDTDVASSPLPEIIGAREVVVILDNCEHVRASAADLVRRTLDACPGVRFLTTSRQRLDLPGDEATYHLLPLAWPGPAATWREALDTPSVQLLRHRASLHQPSSQLSEVDLPAVIEFTSSVGGLPLAIELGAARLRALSLSDICREMNVSLDVLAGGDLGIPDRHRTMQNAVAWSYRSLGDTERRALDRLTAFSGSTDLTTLIAAGEPVLSRPMTLDAITSLVDKSLVTRSEADGISRYSLHPLVREFVRSQLSPGELDAAAEGHARALARTAATLGRGPSPHLDAQWISHHELDCDNLRAAVEHLARHDVQAALRLLVDVEPGLALTSSMNWWDERLEQLAADDDESDVDLSARILAQLLMNFSETRDPRGDQVHESLRVLTSAPLGSVARCAAVAAITRWNRKEIGAQPDAAAIDAAVTAADRAGGTYWPFMVRYMMSMDLPRAPALRMCRDAIGAARRHGLRHFERLARVNIAVSEQFSNVGDQALFEWRDLFVDGACISDLTVTDACFYLLAESEHGSIEDALPIAEQAALELRPRASGAVANELHTVVARVRMIAGDDLGASEAIRLAAAASRPRWDFLGGLHRLTHAALLRRHGRPLGALSELGRLVEDVGYRGVTDLGARTLEELAAIAAATSRHDLAADLVATAAAHRIAHGQPASPIGQAEIMSLVAALGSRRGHPLPLDAIADVASELAG